MKLESVVGYACGVIEKALDEMAMGQPTTPSEHVHESYQQTFPQSGLTPTRQDPEVYSSVIAVINEALTNKGYKVSDALQDPELPLGPDDAGVFVPDSPFSRNLGGKVSVVAADPRALSKAWAGITEEAKRIAKQKDLGKGDKPIT